jgi:hypothetical protein
MYVKNPLSAFPSTSQGNETAAPLCVQQQAATTSSSSPLHALATKIIYFG